VAVHIDCQPNHTFGQWLRQKFRLVQPHIGIAHHEIPTSAPEREAAANIAFCGYY
jgi:hypothetical protein